MNTHYISGFWKPIPLPVLLIGLLTVFSSCSSGDKSSSHESDLIRVLIVDGFSNHNWPQTTKLVTQILERSGRIRVDVSTSPPTAEAPGWDQWRPQFSDYDVVVQNTNDIKNGPSWPREVQRSLEKFVQTGGGLYILHSGNNAFPEWEAYNRMIGLGWRDKDFGWAITVSPDGQIIRVPAGQGDKTNHGKRINAVLTRLGNHPIHKGLPKRFMAADLEVYRYARGPAENLEVISYTRDLQTGFNFPVEWVVRFGEGKVYNSTFGHVWTDDVNPPGARCVAFQTLLVRAVEWLASGDTSSPVPDNFPTSTAIRLAE